MNQFYLFDYLKNNTEIDKSKLDLLKNEIDLRLYSCGDYFKKNKDNKKKMFFSFRHIYKSFLRNAYILYSFLRKKKINRESDILSNAFFGANSELEKKGFNIFRPLHNVTRGWQIASNLKIYINFLRINSKIENSNIKYLISAKFLKILDLFLDQLTEYYKYLNLKALVVPNDTSFFELINIEVFKRLKKPTFIFLHGLPGRYNIYDENETDYLVVWGKKIKENYVNAGFNPDKIIISGHPIYQKFSNNTLRNDLSDVLVLSRSLSGLQCRDKVRLYDQGNAIIYLCSVEKALKSLGVKKVRLRVHQSENLDWYYKFIDKDFFIPDTNVLEESLSRSTLVIGPTSTVFLEALYYGVNYLVYEPVIEGKDLSGYNPVPPFDGSDNKVPVAKDEKSLSQMLIKGEIVDKSALSDYIDIPFNLDFIKDLI